MAYRRRNQWHNSWNENKPANITFAWNSLVGAYDLHFDQVYGDAKWEKIKGILAWIKTTIPYGERDYDDVSKVWTIHEKYFNNIKMVLNSLGADYNVTVVERPIGGPAITFTPIDTYFKIFESASGIDISKLTIDDFNQAKKIYFKTAMRLHPDHGGDAKLMTDFNHAWDVLKERHFKIQRVMEQVQ